MNKKALLAVMIALLIPLVSYFIVKGKSENAIHMPKHYLPDSIISNTERGKRVSDTVWHKINNLSLTNQDGKHITWDSLKGKIVILDFFFTRCPTICPGMTNNMKRLAESIHNGQRVGDKTNKLVHFLSISIDPERDSVERLKYWANRFQVNPETWWLLTGDRKTIYDFALNDIKLGLIDGEGVDSNFVHSDKFVLIDSFRQVRGYYSGLDSGSLSDLSKDLVMLTMEKDPNKKSFLSGKLEIIAVAFLTAILGVFTLLYFLNKSKKNA